MEQSPRSWLRISLFKVGEEERIGEVLQAGGVVGHDVDLSWEVEGDMVVSVEALVLAGPVA